MTGGSVRLRMAVIEASQLGRLVDDLRDLVGAERDVDDPAVARLTPDAYPDDAGASQTFQETTRSDLLDRRSADAAVVAAGLAGLRADLSAISEQEAFAEHEVTIGSDQVDAWLRTLTALRLVIAERIGIVDEEENRADDARYGVYDWLAYRLESLVEAADELL
ncbi:hypothetical protein MHM582_1540 [Microbacterium sp. HM58-2]|nr:hypothetical protein MHM582_1540 [Microbacterium sp. HM58-2]